VSFLQALQGLQAETCTSLRKGPAAAITSVPCGIYADLVGGLALESFTTSAKFLPVTM
jgi:hypothetical protein